MKTFLTILLLSLSTFAQVAQVAHGGTGQNLAGNNYVLIGTSSYVYMLVSLPDCQDTAGNHWNYNATTHVVSCGNTSAVVTCGAMPALTGDVTSTAGTCTTVVGNLPTGVTQAGTIVGTNIAAPSSPASGHINDWFDSTDLRFHDKNASGVIGTTVVAHTAATHKFITGISAAGVLTEGQPDYADLSGTQTHQLIVGFGITSGATGTNVGPKIGAPYAGTFSKCVIVTNASDGTTDLTFKLNKNGTDIFSADPTITHATATGTVTTTTSLTTVPLSVAANDVFSIDISSGTSNWIFTVQCVQ